MTKYKKIQYQQQYNNMIMNQESVVNDFVKNVPIDIGYNVLLSFLVWGGGGDDDDNNYNEDAKGVLTSTPYQNQNQNQEMNNSQSLHPQYSPSLLIPICKVWPGFITCLFVNLIDYIHQLEEEYSSFSHDYNNKNIGTTACNDEDQLDDAIMINLKKKITNAFTWIQYLLSNEFYNHLGWIQRKDEDKECENEGDDKDEIQNKEATTTSSTTTTINKMSTVVSLDIIMNYIQLPLNSLCDKCIEHCESIMSYHQRQKQQHQQEKMATLTSPLKALKTTIDIIHLLEHILKEKRSVHYGLVFDQTTTTATITTHQLLRNITTSKKRKVESESIHGNDDNVVENKLNLKNEDLVEPNINVKKKKSSNGNNTMEVHHNTNDENEVEIMLSLDEIENMLENDTFKGNVNNKEEGIYDDVENKHVNNIITVDTRNTSSSSNDKQNFVECNDIDQGKDTDDALCNMKENSIPPWTLCNTWDACTIGTLPGYVT